MTIREQIDAAFRKARLARDEPTKNVISMLKNKILMELKAGKGAEENDELWTSVLEGYSKQQRKAIPELQKAGERGTEAVREAEFEIEFCARYLPQKLGEAETEALVRQTAAEHGINDAKQMGKLIGLVMKNHGANLDGDLTRAVAQRVLSQG